MSYPVLRKRYSRLSDKLEAVQTLANMGLAEVDYVKLDRMETHPSPSNRFIRSTEKWLQETIENALAKTDFNIVFSNMHLEESDVSDTNKFSSLIIASSVLQLSKTCFAATVKDPEKIADSYNGREYNYYRIRAYCINEKKKSLFATFAPWFFN